MSAPDPLRVNRAAFSTGWLRDEPDDKAYWLAQSTLARIEAIEIARQAVYGYDPATLRLQRILTIARLQRG